jgi:hypothetical protein
MIGSNGVESITDEDQYYHGSRFSDVQKAVFSNPYYEFWGSKGGDDAGL